MLRLTIPQHGDAVDYFVTFDGDEEVTGPLDALVLAVDLTSMPFPVLDLRVCYPHEQLAVVYSVPFRQGRRYWLPK